MRVDFVDLKARYEEEKKELNECINRVLAKGNLVLSKEVDELETDICNYTGSRYCVGLNSGTDALMIALWANGIGKGDEVIIPSISFFATVGAVVHVGATPRFCDVNADMNIDVEYAENLITDKTKAIMPVHWAGRTANMSKIKDLAKRHTLLVVEDSAQSMGGRYNGQHPGTFGIAGAISCHPLKNLNGLGDGGLLLTSTDEIYQKAKRYRNHGMVQRDKAEIFGINSRLDTINAEVIKFRLRGLDKVISKRNENVRLYRELLNIDEITFPVSACGSDIDTQVMFIVRAKHRDALKEYLKSKEIEALVYYGTPLHLHEATINLGDGPGSLPTSENICSEVLALPHNQTLTSDQINFVCSEIKNFYKR
ncbi:DegT/DnrJ/EryC1/StrS family aminotransferase [Paracoccaceae bacterium]|nr:DegT/DnrJ/EryC1/StrS family aminotransferase [Paracoccaceae bacterium]MDA9990850.1 DegT/DnrJ/EryC1/StrS family aminotransferase [Paracoccaceae bacterium]